MKHIQFAYVVTLYSFRNSMLNSTYFHWVVTRISNHVRQSIQIIKH